MKLSKLNHFLIYTALLFSFCFSQSGHFISGKVVDKDNTPLFGANIILKGTFMGSTSDFEGNYRIDNIDPGKYSLMISYIGYKSQELEIYISEFEMSDDEEEDSESSFSSKLGIEEDDEEEEEEEEEKDSNILKASFHENINFTLIEDALETEQVVVSASKKKEKLIDAPITIAVVSEQQIHCSHLENSPRWLHWPKREDVCFAGCEHSHSLQESKWISNSSSISFFVFVMQPMSPSL